MTKVIVTSRVFLQYLGNLSTEECMQCQAFFNCMLSPKQQLAIAYLIKCKEEQVIPEEEKLIAYLQIEMVSKQRQYLKRFFHKCTEIIEDFLAFQEMRRKENKMLKTMFLLERLKKPEEQDLFKRSLEKVIKLIGNEQSVEQLISTLLLSHKIFFHPTMDLDLKLNNTKSPVLNWQEFLSLLEVSYQAAKEKYVGIGLLDNRLKHSAIRPISRSSIHILVRVYRQFSDVFQNFNDSKYQIFKEYFHTLVKQNLISKREQITLFRLHTSLIAHAVRNDKRYMVEALEHYTLGIQNDLLKIGGVVPPEHFFNFIAIACSQGKRYQAKRFLLKFQNKLHFSKRKEVLHICKTIMLLDEGEFEKAYLAIHNRNFRDPHLRLIARSNRLMACYHWDMEIGMYLKGKEYSIREELRSFRLVLKRLESILGKGNDRLIANENFRAMTKEIVKASSSPPSKIVKNNLQRKLDGYHLIVYKKWLQKQIEYLD